MNFLVPAENVRPGDRICTSTDGKGEYLTVIEVQTHPSSSDNVLVDTLIPERDWDWSTYPTYGEQVNDDALYGEPTHYVPEDCRQEHAFRWGEVVFIETENGPDLVLDESLSPIRWWVCVWDVDMAYGGPEEGGWHFQTGRLLAAIGTSSYEGALSARNSLEQAVENPPLHYDDWWDVHGDLRFEVAEKRPDPYFPAVCPHYE